MMHRPLRPCTTRALRTASPPLRPACVLRRGRAVVRRRPPHRRPRSRQQQVIAFASTSLYRPRPCYAGKALVLGLCRTGLARAWCRSPGIGGAPTGSGESWLLEVGVTGVCRKHGEPRAAPLTGFREVGVYEKHAQLDGIWRDVVIVERILPVKVSSGKDSRPSDLCVLLSHHLAASFWANFRL